MIDDWLSYWSDEDGEEFDGETVDGWEARRVLELGEISERVVSEGAQFHDNPTPRLLDLLHRREQRLFRILARLNVEMQLVGSQGSHDNSPVEDFEIERHCVDRWIGEVSSCAICLNGLDDDAPESGVKSVVLRYKTMSTRLPMRTLSLISAFEGFDGSRLVSCGHEFHESCLTRWLSRSRSCPLCRHQLSCPRELLD